MRGLALLVVVLLPLTAAALPTSAGDPAQAAGEAAVQGAEEQLGLYPPEDGQAQPVQASPTRREVSAQAEQILRQNKAQAQQLVDQRVAELIEQRARRMSWVRQRPGQNNWLSLPRLYLGSLHRTGDACDAEGRCSPRTQVLFGVSADLHVAGFLDLTVRGGGVAHLLDFSAAALARGEQRAVRFGGDVSAGPRLHLLGYVGLGAGWYMQTEEFLTVEASDGGGPRAVAKTLDRHGFWAALHGQLLGTTVAAECRVGPRRARMPDGSDWTDTMGVCGAILYAPPMWGI